jgi:hypothetical protein
MSYQLQEQNLNKAEELLQNEQIDLWLIFTSEGSDPCLPFVTGFETVGPGAFLITGDGRRLAVCSTIDAQDIRECGLFEKVLTYQGDLDEVLKNTVKELSPGKIALNFSEEHPIADGLTVGRHRWLKEMLKGVYDHDFVSAENVMISLDFFENETRP